MTSELKPFSGKLTYNPFWASKGSSFTIMECCDLTYERRPVAVVEEQDFDYNRNLAAKICNLLNTRTPDLTLLESPEMVEKLAKILSWYPDRGNLDCAKAALAEIRKARGGDDANILLPVSE